MSTKAHRPSESAPPEMQQQAMDGLLALFAAVRGQMRETLRDSPPGLAPMHMRMLKHCLHHPGVSQQALVVASGRDKGQIARLVKELDAQRLLLRQPDPADRRSQRLTLTPAGRAACQRFRRQESAMARQLFAAMAAHELQALVEQLAVLRHRLGPPDRPA